MRAQDNCKRLRAPPRQPGRPQPGKEERGFRKGGGGGVVGGGVGGGLRHSLCRSHRQAGPSTASVCSSSKRLGGVPQGRGGGGGGVRKFCMGGRVGLGGRRPDPGLLVPDASRQEAEANLPVPKSPC